MFYHANLLFSQPIRSQLVTHICLYSFNIIAGDIQAMCLVKTITVCNSALRLVNSFTGGNDLLLVTNQPEIVLDRTNQKRIFTGGKLSPSAISMSTGRLCIKMFLQIAEFFCLLDSLGISQFSAECNLFSVSLIETQYIQPRIFNFAQTFLEKVRLVQNIYDDISHKRGNH